MIVYVLDNREAKVNNINVEEIVKQVIANMEGKSTPNTSTSHAIPQKSRVAMLTSLENYEIKEFPIPAVGDDDILVKVEIGRAHV